MEKTPNSISVAMSNPALPVATTASYFLPSNLLNIVDRQITEYLRSHVKLTPLLSAVKLTIDLP